MGFKLTPHMLRHTHATELMRHGIESSLIQKRLGHASLQTTIDNYAHIDNDTMKQALHAFWESQEDKK